MTGADTSSVWAPYRVHTHNPSSHSENRMHSDDVARKFGFKGALVPGVTVFSHLTQPLVARFGEAWLARGTADVSFSKPAYDGELLTIRTSGESAFNLTCINEQGEELARMQATLPAAPSPPDPRGNITPAPPLTERQTVAWDLMEIGKPFPALHWAPTLDENLGWCRDNRDDLAIYREGTSPLLHPGFILRQANYVLRHRFLLPAWIHAASRITFFEAARAGHCYEVRAIPEEKWNRKGHEFARLYVAIRSDDRTVAEVAHTVIFNPRQRAASS